MVNVKKARKSTKFKLTYTFLISFQIFLKGDIDNNTAVFHKPSEKKTNKGKSSRDISVDHSNDARSDRGSNHELDQQYKSEENSHNVHLITFIFFNIYIVQTIFHRRRTQRPAFAGFRPQGSGEASTLHI